jgi:hypothetical protein
MNVKRVGAPMSEVELLAEQIISLLYERAGFDEWWHSIDVATQADIKKDLAELLEP